MQKGSLRAVLVGLRRSGGARAVVAVIAALFLAPAASAQILGPLGGGGPLGLPSLDVPLQGALGDVRSTLEETRRELRPERLAQLRLDRVERLVRANRRVLDLDGAGEAVVRGQVLAVAPSVQSLEIARQAGFSAAAPERLEGLDLEVITLTVPAGLATREAIRVLRALDPAGVYDFNHLYAGGGVVSVGAASAASLAGEAAPGGVVRLGLVDTGVDAAHPVFRGLSIAQRPFAPGGVSPAAHGTAVASLAAGRSGGFQGAAPGATLLVADVYGRGPTGGATDAVLRGLSWLAAERVPVINISLVGPPNAALAAAVSALRRRGVLIVAPVGNDGPAAPPLYPAAYPEVIAVTAVDARGKVLIEAGRARRLDFAAPGAVTAAKPGRGFAPVRGTSFASPIVAARLALLLPAPSPTGAEQALDGLARAAKPAPEYGRGLVGDDLRLAGGR